METGYNQAPGDGLRLPRTIEPCSVVVFGASGDLTKRKLIPALYTMAQKKLLPDAFSVIGAARTPMKHEDFRAAMLEANRQFSESAAEEEQIWQQFAQGLFYNTTDTNSPDSYRKLGELLDQLDSERGTSGNRLFFLATPPAMFEPIIARIGELGLNRSSSGGWTRIVIEKPFGLDLTGARKLNQQVLSVFREEEVFRIDHYLGKETVQNIMVLRFANGLFEPLWNRNYIDHVQITAAESIGVEERAEYYEQAGALRDMIQNHMMQLLTLVAMEPPASLEANDIRNEKTKVLGAIRPFVSSNIYEYAVRGQYGGGVFSCETVRSYRQEPGVSSHSNTETYAAVKIMIENWRWANVPFFLRSGKRLPKRLTEIAIQFKPAPHLLFRSGIGEKPSPNVLLLRIQPDEGISLSFNAKTPGQFTAISPVSMDFSYDAFGQKSTEAYVRLLLDAMRGDSSLYARADMVEKTWELFSPVLEAWEHSASPVPIYEPGSWGPSAADEMLARERRFWRKP